MRSVVAALLLAATPVLAEGIGWQEAVARLAGERTRAETCTRLLKQYGDDAAIARGELTYGDAKAEIDAVIAGLIVALADDGEPASLPDLEARLTRGVEGREALCTTVEAMVPETDGERNVIVDLAAAAIGPLIEAATEIYLNWVEGERLTRLTIQNQLEATQWPAFAAIASD